MFYDFNKCNEIKSSNFQHTAKAGFSLPLPQVHDCQNQQQHHHWIGQKYNILSEPIKILKFLCNFIIHFLFVLTKFAEL
jgi:hypothetical protein